MHYTHIVKVHHYRGGTSVVYRGFQEECRTYAQNMNERYQTDNYRVEPYAPERYLSDNYRTKVYKTGGYQP